MSGAVRTAQVALLYIHSKLCHTVHKSPGKGSNFKQQATDPINGLPFERQTDRRLFVLTKCQAIETASLTERKY
jgi:hypothetical protein